MGPSCFFLFSAVAGPDGPRTQPRYRLRSGPIGPRCFFCSRRRRGRRPPWQAIPVVGDSRGRRLSWQATLVAGDPRGRRLSWQASPVAGDSRGRRPPRQTTRADHPGDGPLETPEWRLPGTNPGQTTRAPGQNRWVLISFLPVRLSSSFFFAYRFFTFLQKISMRNLRKS